MASTNSEDTTNSCRSSSCGCEPQVSRRDVLQILGVSATASALPIGTQVMAQGFKGLFFSSILAVLRLRHAWTARSWISSLVSFCHRADF